MIISWSVLLPLLLPTCAWEAAAVVHATVGTRGTAARADATAGLFNPTVSVDQELANLVIQRLESIYQYPSERAPIVHRFIQYLTSYTEKFLPELPGDDEQQEIYDQDSHCKKAQEAYTTFRDLHQEIQLVQPKYFEAEENDEKAWNQFVEANLMYYIVRKEYLPDIIANPEHKDDYDKAGANCLWTLQQHLSARDSLLKLEKSFLETQEQYTLALGQYAIARQRLTDTQDCMPLVSTQTQESYPRARKSYPPAQDHYSIVEGFDPRIPSPRHQLPYLRDSERYRRDQDQYPMDIENIRPRSTADQVVAEELELLQSRADSQVEHERVARERSRMESNGLVKIRTLERRKEDEHDRRESRPDFNEQKPMPRLPRGPWHTASLGDNQNDFGPEQRSPSTLAKPGANFGQQVCVEDFLSVGNVEYDALAPRKETTDP